MARTVIATGREAVRQSASSLAVSLASAVAGPLRPGAQWRFDHLLVSAGRNSVRFLAGSVLYEEDLESFATREFPSGGDAASGRWLEGLSRHEIAFFMGLAGTLIGFEDESAAGCSFFGRFSFYYGRHRTGIELAARELRYVLDGLFALMRFPGLFAACMGTMGPQAQASLPKGVSQRDIASFLGWLLASEQVAIGGLPATVRSFRQATEGEAAEVRKVPHLALAMEKLERAAARAAPVIDLLRADRVVRLTSG